MVRQVRKPGRNSDKVKKRSEPTNDLILQRLDRMLDQRQALYRLSHVFDWEGIEKDFEGLYAERGRPAKPIRLMVGLLLLKHIED